VLDPSRSGHSHVKGKAAESQRAAASLSCEAENRLRNIGAGRLIP
jgi:hypothetical protein